MLVTPGSDLASSPSHNGDNKFEITAQLNNNNGGLAFDEASRDQVLRPNRNARDPPDGQADSPPRQLTRGTADLLSAGRYHIANNLPSTTMFRL